MMRQGYDRLIVQTQGYMKNTLSRTCFMAGLMVSFMAGGLSFATGNAHAATVFLVCDGNFKTITGVSDPHSRSKGAHASAGASYYDGSSDMSQEAFRLVPR